MTVRLPQLLLIFVQALAAHEGVHEGRAHRCIHDELHPRVAVRPQRYAELSDRDHEHRALATDADDWQPLRIAVDYSSIDNATTLATIQDLVPYATSKLGRRSACGRRSRRSSCRASAATRRPCRRRTASTASPTPTSCCT